MHTERKQSFLFKSTALAIVITFLTGSIVPPPKVGAQSVLNLPIPGSMVHLSPAYAPAILKGIKIFPDNPLRFDFIVDTGDTTLTGKDLKSESAKLIKYFLAALTVPEDDLWVNLSPYESDRIIPKAFGATEMGRDLLAQDYILKQLTASLIHPDKELGKSFWKNIYAKTQALYGTTKIPVNTFNKVWIVPERAGVYSNANSVFVMESHLKVMSENDYKAITHQKIKNSVILNESEGRMKDLDNLDSSAFPENDNHISSEIMRKTILPTIEKEVNTGKHFTQLRQIYNAVILATWFKRNLRKSLLGKIYVDQDKIAGVDIEDKSMKEKIYQQYLEAFKKGAFNFIKEETHPETQKVIPRQYFSGGSSLRLNTIKEWSTQEAASPIENTDKTVLASVNLEQTSSLETQDRGKDFYLQEKNPSSANSSSPVTNQRNLKVDPSRSYDRHHNIFTINGYRQNALDHGYVNHVFPHPDFKDRVIRIFDPEDEEVTGVAHGGEWGNYKKFAHLGLKSIPKTYGSGLTANGFIYTDVERIYSIRSTTEGQAETATFLLSKNHKNPVVIEEIRKFIRDMFVELIENKIYTETFKTGNVMLGRKYKESGDPLAYLHDLDQAHHLPNLTEGEIAQKYKEILRQYNQSYFRWPKIIYDDLLLLFDTYLKEDQNTHKPSFDSSLPAPKTATPLNLSPVISSPVTSSPGGIDLTPDTMNLHDSGEGGNFNMPASLPLINGERFDGLTPVIFQITPITNLPLLLGMNMPKISRN